ncbi:MAG: hypothetical protein WA324_20920 [Bryobacteraceae bacterium]
MRDSLISAIVKSKTNRAPIEIPPEVKPVVLKLIQNSPAPIRPVDLIKSAGLPKKVTGKALQAALAEELETEQIFNWGTKTSHLYWHCGPEAEARQRLLSLAASEVLDQASSTARAAAGQPKLSKTVVGQALKDLVHQQRLSLVASPPGSKKKQVVNREHPEPYLVWEIGRLLQDFGREQLTSRVAALLSDKDADARPAAASSAKATVQEVAAAMFEAVNRIAFSPGTTVTFYRLRQQPELAHIPKEIFDQAALLLEHERKALLSLHDHAAALPPEERQQFVTDGLGTYYVSIYAR